MDLALIKLALGRVLAVIHTDLVLLGVAVCCALAPDERWLFRAATALPV